MSRFRCSLQSWRLVVAGLACAIGSTGTRAAAPSWWSASGTSIMGAGTANDWAPLNLGQLKNVAIQAKNYLVSRVGGTGQMGGAGSAVTSLCAGFTSSENYAPVNVGQLKNVAKVFYDRLAELGFNWQTGAYGTPTQKYPWTGTYNPENGAPANLGQLKFLFSFTLDDTFRALMTDSDADGIPDFWEQHYAGTLTNALTGITAAGDLDGDGLSNLMEFRAGTDPWVKDSDGDGVSDKVEVLAGLNPLDDSDLAKDSDGDGIPDGVEAILRLEAQPDRPSLPAWLQAQLRKLDPYSNRDADGDGIPDDYETLFGMRSDTAASLTQDTDGDGLPDQFEALVRTWAAVPASYGGVSFTSTDSNQNGVWDIFEPQFGFAVTGYIPAVGNTPASFTPPDPRDTDGDGAWDGQEVLSGSDPRDPSDTGFPALSGVGGSLGIGGAVAPGLFQGGYSNPSNSAFQWTNLSRIDSISRSGEQNGLDSGPPKGQFVTPAVSISTFYSSVVASVTGTWSPWSSVNSAWFSSPDYGGETWGTQLADEGWFTQPQEFLTGWKYSMSGGQVPRRIIVDSINSTQKVTTANVPSRPYFSRELTEHTHVRREMYRIGKATELKKMILFNNQFPPGDTRVKSASMGRQINSEEFYFGSNQGAGFHASRQYLDQKNGIDLVPTTEKPGGVCYLTYYCLTFSSLTESYFQLHFPPNLHVTMQGEEIRSDVDYPCDIFNSLMTVSADSIVNGRTFFIGITGRVKDVDVDAVEAVGGGRTTTNTPHFSVIEGPLLKLVQGRQSAEPGNAYSLNLSEDGGARFRKISLEGLPLADGKPQTAAESDSRADDSYVDALNLTLTHHTSDLYVPIANSDLALSADRNLRQETYLDSPGQYPPSATDDADKDGYIGRPFGLCWTSNLTPHVLFEIDSNLQTPSIATVIDETGSALRFAYGTATAPAGSPSTPSKGFIPLPSPSDQTTLLNRLDVIEETGGVIKKLDLRKRFGTVVHYELVGYSDPATGRRRFYYRIKSGTSSTSLVPGIEDRYGNFLCYSYSPLAPGVVLGNTLWANPAELAPLLIPASITDRSLNARSLVISPASIPGLNATQNKRFIGSIVLKENGSVLQQTNYVYKLVAQPDLALIPPDSSGYNSTYPVAQLVFLKEVDRLTAPGEYIPQSFDYAAAYDQDAENEGNYHAHLWLSKITEGTGISARYHRFETVFDRTRTFYYGSGGSRQVRCDQGLERPISAVYFGTGNGQEQLISEFKLQQAPTGQQAGFKVSNAYNLTSDPTYTDPPVITGNRINAVVDADRRIRYYKFTAPVVRDTKAFQDYFFPQGADATKQRSVLIAWTQMEIDHTGGAKETYTFDPLAMMALKSSEMTIPSVFGSTTTRTDWEYKSPFTASAACAFLAGRTYTGYNDAHVYGTWSIDLHPFFAKWYPDPTLEARTLNVPGGVTSYSVPAGNGSQIVKTYKYWADDQATPDNSKPWSRTMVESSIGYRSSSSGSVADSTRTLTLTTLNVTTPPSPADNGLPLIERVFGPGIARTGTPDKTTNMYYGTPAGGSSFPVAPTFLWKTEIKNGVQTTADGTSPAQPLTTLYWPDKYMRAQKTVTGNAADSAASTWHYTQRNALGQTLAEYDGQLSPEPADLAGSLSTNPAATRFTYRMDGRLKRVDYPQIAAGTTVFPNGTVASNSGKTYEYDSTGRKIFENQIDGPAATGTIVNRTVFNYDTLGRVWRTYLDLPPLSAPEPEAGDQVTSSSFSASGLLLTQTAPSGLLTTYQYDWLRRITSQQITGDGVTTSTSFAYDGGYCGDSLFSASSFKPTRTVGPSTHSTGAPATIVTVYDSLFRKVKESREYLPGIYADTTWGYDVQGRPLKVLDPGGKLTTTAYDALGNPKKVTRPDTSFTATQWTAAGLPWEVSESVPAVSSFTAQTRVTRTVYDAAGGAAYVHLPHPSVIGTVESSSPTEYNQWFQYDTAGRRTTTTTRQSAIGVTPVVRFSSTTSYDGRGRVAKVLGDTGSVIDYGADSFTGQAGTTKTEFKYDSQNRQTWSRVDRGASPLPPGLNAADNPYATLTVYDAAGRAIRTVSPVITTTSHTGTLASVTQVPSRLMTRTAYDSSGNVLALQTGFALPADKLSDKDAWNAAQQNAYTWGNTPAVGETLNSYDKRGRLGETRRTSSAGNVISETFAYDAVGNRTRVVDGNSRGTSFTYDSLGRVLTTTQNDAATGQKDTVTNIYDPLVLKQTTDGAGKTTVFTYDSLYRLRTVSPTSGGTQDPFETHYYNSAGERISVSYSGASWRDSSWKYDARGRVTGETSIGLTHSYSYDAAGNRLTAVYPLDTTGTNTRKLTSTYDRLNRLSSCVETYNDATTGPTTNYYYDLTGGIRRRTLPNNTREDKFFDIAGRVTTQATYSGASTTPVSQSVNSYDLFGNLLRQVETRPATGVLTDGGRTVLNTYDGISRLIKESCYAGTSTINPTDTVWAYDNANNRTSQTKSPGGTDIYDYASLFNAAFPVAGGEVDGYRPNQLVKITPASGGYIHFRYDGNGNRTRRWNSVSNLLTSYTWDRYNRLVAVSTCTAPTGIIPFRCQGTSNNGNMTTMSAPAGSAGPAPTGKWNWNVFRGAPPSAAGMAPAATPPPPPAHSPSNISAAVTSGAAWAVCFTPSIPPPERAAFQPRMPAGSSNMGPGAMSPASPTPTGQANSAPLTRPSAITQRAAPPAPAASAPRRKRRSLSWAFLTKGSVTVIFRQVRFSPATRRDLWMAPTSTRM